MDLFRIWQFIKCIISGVVFIKTVIYLIKPKSLIQGCHPTRKCKEVTLTLYGKVTIPPVFSETVPEI